MSFIKFENIVKLFTKYWEKFLVTGVSYTLLLAAITEHPDWPESERGDLLGECDLIMSFLMYNDISAMSRLHRSAVAPYITDAFISEDAGASKPSRAYFDYVFAHIPGITRENCLLIGDSPSSDLRGANNYGIPCCWYNPQGLTRPEGLRIDYEIRDLPELLPIVNP